MALPINKQREKKIVHWFYSFILPNCLYLTEGQIKELSDAQWKWLHGQQEGLQCARVFDTHHTMIGSMWPLLGGGNDITAFGIHMVFSYLPPFRNWIVLILVFQNIRYVSWDILCYGEAFWLVIYKGCRTGTWPSRLDAGWDVQYCMSQVFGSDPWLLTPGSSFVPMQTWEGSRWSLSDRGSCHRRRPRWNSWLQVSTYPNPHYFGHLSNESMEAWSLLLPLRKTPRSPVHMWECHFPLYSLQNLRCCMWVLLQWKLFLKSVCLFLTNIYSYWIRALFLILCPLTFLLSYFLLEINVFWLFFLHPNLRHLEIQTIKGFLCVFSYTRIWPSYELLRNHLCR